MKRAIDIVGAAVGLAVLSPVLALVSAAIVWDSGLPVLYRGERVGRGGKAFRMLKFRTMVRDAERLGGTSTGLNDARITRVGSALRRYKLDELPQLINVLIGDMSLVGPRPEVREYTDLYTTEELEILSVRPGITDYSSIEFIDLAERLGSDQPDEVYAKEVRPVKNRLRLEYARRHSLGEDFRILFATLAALFGIR